MSNSKISALTSATTPLAGTETLPIVQGGATTKVTVANLTAGRAVSADSMTLTTALAATSGGTGSTSAFVANAIPYASSTTVLSTSSNWTYNGTNVVLLNGGLGIGSASLTGFSIRLAKTITGAVTSYGIYSAGAIQSDVTTGANIYESAPSTAAASFTLTTLRHFRANQGAFGLGSAVTTQIGFLAESSLIGATNNYGFYGAIASAAGRYNLYMTGTASNYLAGGLNVGAATDPGAGNISLTGNVVQGTAAKGFDFSANTPLAGKTSTILNWYEEGTWTPNQGAGLTLVGAFSSTGRYTRIGRQVSISGTVTGATSVAVTAAGVITSNLPFTVNTAGHGDATNAAVTASATVICTGTSVTSAAAIAATGTITFSATYFV